jgi:hypothetical protein
MDKQLQRRGRIKHVPAANDLLEQQIGWQGKDVRLTATESLSASASTFSELLRQSEWQK